LVVKYVVHTGGLDGGHGTGCSSSEPHNVAVQAAIWPVCKEQGLLEGLAGGMFL
jgi:hypothetical protein